MMEMTISEYLDLTAWYSALPPLLRNVVRLHPPGSRWHLRRQSTIGSIDGVPVKADDWFSPESFTARGQIKLRLCSGETGMALPACLTVGPAELIPAGS